MPRGIPNSKVASSKATAALVGDVPRTATSAQTHDTTEDNTELRLPSTVHGAPIDDPAQALSQGHSYDVNRLHNFLMVNYPDEFNRSNRQRPETAVEIAMRLLSGVSNSKMQTCQAPYCNLPAPHQGEHGWVQSVRR